MYGNLIKIKELFYGPESESIITPLRNLGISQLNGEKKELALETYDRAILIAKRLLQSGKAKEKDQVKAFLSELVNLKYSIYESDKNFKMASKVADEFIQLTNEIFTEEST